MHPPPEKHRKTQVVVDLYAGIGYFTLPYLVHAQASKVIACEWNPEAVEMLKRNLKDNKVGLLSVGICGTSAPLLLLCCTWLAMHWRLLPLSLCRSISTPG